MAIPIQNIYYLLCYAWNKLEQREEVNVNNISTTELVDLFAKVLINSTAKVLKRGLDRYYVEQEQEIGGIKGKLNLTNSIKQNKYLIKSYAVFFANVQQHLNEVIF